MGTGPRSNAEWQRWGEIDPMFGVSSWAGKRIGDEGAWQEEEFLALGEQDWGDFRTRWEHYGLTPGACVEIGSGAGRMTRPMAGYFTHVYGVDVAQGMIEVAERHTLDLPVSLHLTDGLTLPFEDASMDAAFSTHVFQHLDTDEDAQRNWSEAVRVLRPGGTLFFHMPMHFWPGGLEVLQHVYDTRRRLGDLRAGLKRRQMRRGHAEPIMRGQSYLWDHVERSLIGLGCTDVELNLFRVSSNDGQHCCVLARKA